MPLVEAGNVDNPFGFTGYQADRVSGLYYAQARHYSPAAGRFAARDTHWNPDNMIYGDNPANNRVPDMLSIRQAGNLYAYCMNDSVAYVDKTGNDAAVAGEIFRWGWTTGGIVSQFDSPIPGPADIVGAIIGVGATLFAGGILLYDYWTDGSSALKPRQAEIIPFPNTPPDNKNNPTPAPVPLPLPKPRPNEKDDKDVILYRDSADTPMNFTPRPGNDDSGWSLFATPPASGNYLVTTRNTLRAQGWTVEPTHINPGRGWHYSVTPGDMSLYPGWQASRAQYKANPATNVWTNTNIHPLTTYLRAAFITKTEWGNQCE